MSDSKVLEYNAGQHHVFLIPEGEGDRPVFCIDPSVLKKDGLVWKYIDKESREKNLSPVHQEIIEENL